MKVITIVSSRPELIRLHLIIDKLDRALQKNHILIHTGQNFTKELTEQFFNDLNIRKPDFQFNLTEQKHGFDYAGLCMTSIYKTLSLFDPKQDKILILGDVNGAFYSAYVARIMGYKLYHMEAGNRCFNQNVPEEINRRAIDTFSHKLLTYTQRSRENLLREGYSPDSIIVIGNPIGEVITSIHERTIYHFPDILVTVHRTENVTNKSVLTSIVSQLNVLAKDYKIIISLHPKLKDYLTAFSLKFHDSITTEDPFDLSTFVALQKKTKLVITDSGTVPEESAILGKPCILIRDNTERPELLEQNQMIVSSPHNFVHVSKLILDNKMTFTGIPEEYKKSTSSIVLKILLGDL